MANKNLFGTSRGEMIPPADTKNDAGGAAYALTPEQTLAQLATTGCLTDTYYANAEMQLERVLEACKQVTPEYIARTALYARREGYMKDMPALLCAILSTRDVKLLAQIFDRVIDNGKMLRNFVQIMRSGVVGRKSLGTRPKKLVQNWLNTIHIKKLIEAYVGQDPSLADIIKMVHPKATDPIRNTFFKWVLGHKVDGSMTLPTPIRDFEVWKKNIEQSLKSIELETSDNNPLIALTKKDLPAVPFQMLTAQKLSTKDWTQIALDANWHTVRMNLNTFERHGVYKDEEVVRLLAEKLKDRDVIRRVRVFPYQLYTTYKAATTIPYPLKEALQDALDVSVDNVPYINGRVAIFVDISGSMQASVTGNRGSASSTVNCFQVAGLMAASLAKVNKDAIVIQFSNDAKVVNINPRDSVTTNADCIVHGSHGGTDCAAPYRTLNSLGKSVDLIVMISDQESWIESSSSMQHRIDGSSANKIIQIGRGSASMIEFENYRNKFNPNCKLVNIDLAPNTTVQAKELQGRVLNIGGFSDAIFNIINLFMENKLTPDHWVGEINKIDITLESQSREG